VTTSAKLARILKALDEVGFLDSGGVRPAVAAGGAVRCRRLPCSELLEVFSEASLDAIVDREGLRHFAPNRGIVSVTVPPEACTFHGEEKTIDRSNPK